MTRHRAPSLGRLALRGARVAAPLLCLAAALGVVRRGPGPLAAASGGSSYGGVLTFSTPGNGDPFGPTTVQELDIASGQLTVRFDGLDAARARSGETAFIQRLAGGYYADHAVVVADARGVPGAPLHVCEGFSWTDNRGCSTPKVAPDGRLVAFTAVGGGGRVCEGGYGMYWSAYVVVTDRRGAEVARFEGWYDPEWLPDGRLLMMGSACRGAGVWIAPASLAAPARVDGGRVATPAAAPAVSPDGRRLAFVWNNQLWALPLAGRPELTQLTALPKSVTAAAWSPDGGAIAAIMFDISMPVRSLALFRPGDQRSLEIRPLPAYPYGPLSWR